MVDTKENAAVGSGEGDAPPKTAKQLEKEAKKQAKLEKLKQKQEALAEKANKAKDKKDEGEKSKVGALQAFKHLVYEMGFA